MFLEIEDNAEKHGPHGPIFGLKYKLAERFSKKSDTKEEFTPDKMIYYLKMTNYTGHLADMLRFIPEGKEAEFKEAICSAVERRYVAPINVKTMKKIADLGGFIEEFDEANAKDKWISVTTNKTKVFVAKSNDDLQANPDLTKYDMVVCDFEGGTRFADLTKLPKKMIIKGNIDWSRCDFEKLPDISESIVYGNFNCSMCRNLISLEGAPKIVDGDFKCNRNKFNSLKGAPERVGKDFDCCLCLELESLMYAPKEIGGSLNCGHCEKIQSLDGINVVGGFLECPFTELNEKLQGYESYLIRDGKCFDLHNIPKDKEFVINANMYLGEKDKDVDLSNVIVKGDFVWNDKLVPSRNIPKKVEKNFNCTLCNELESKEDLPEEVGGVIYCIGTPLNESLGGRGVYIKRDGEFYDIFNLPKDKEFVINGDLELSYLYLKKLPDLSNVIVKGNFNCEDTSITSLKGAPKEVHGDFILFCSKLTSAKGCPQYIGGKISAYKDVILKIRKELEQRKNPNKMDKFFSRLLKKVR